MNLDAIQKIPDLTPWDKIGPWVSNTIKQVANADFSSNNFKISAVTLPVTPNNMLGAYESADWRRFALGVFAADLACYTNPADQADFPRMLNVVATFPQGFRLYMAEMANGQQLPIGYTGWYPISENIFDVLYNNPQQLTNRSMMAPLKNFEPNQSKVYLFNYSVAEALIGSPTSAKIVKDFAQSFESFPNSGMAAVTVSDHGKRVAEKFGMFYRGDMTHDGEAEGVYCTPVKL